MKKLFIILLIFTLYLVLSQYSLAQSFEQRLGCCTDECGYFIINSCGETIFTVLGNGNIEIGIPNSIFTIDDGRLFCKNSSIATGSQAIVGIADNVSAYGNYGGYFVAEGKQGIGVKGISRYETGLGYGGHFESWSKDGRGVYGSATATGNCTNYGGFFKASGIYGYGVAGSAQLHGVYGISIDDEFGRGVEGEAMGKQGIGVFGVASNSSGGLNYGGKFISNGDGYGVWGESANYVGVCGYSNGTDATGVSGWVPYSNGVAVSGWAGGTNGTGVYGTGGPWGPGVVGKGIDGVRGISTWDAEFSFDFYADGPGKDFGSSSSIRWKRNIELISDPIEKIKSLRGVYFDWDEKHGGHHDIGMVAEEVGKILPEIVAYEKNGIDARGMDYGKLSPLLVEAIKEQQKIIDDLRARIEQLEN